MKIVAIDRRCGHARGAEADYPRLLEDGVIPIMAYNLETPPAEKPEAVVSRGTANTRMRDFYDTFTLLKVKGESIELPVLRGTGRGGLRQGGNPPPENARLALSEVEDDRRRREMRSRRQPKSDYDGESRRMMLSRRSFAS